MGVALGGQAQAGWEAGSPTGSCWGLIQILKESLEFHFANIAFSQNPVAIIIIKK